ncbi:MAG TPA: UbiH/UbiF/VisC/COQ6 family ubiquinone biosynthesis hydroxylase [Stellaceae bacterium]|jgi:2-octaprenyl-6-methoxyphenol hydroxylase|nr:UbiH/UbiF/VisC/COQ6 family ubiquinone biosynthesis hydroxylase [Stellaceae bacterium]
MQFAALTMPGVPSGELAVELIVVGGGLTGLTLGIACAGAGVEVAVIDRESPATMLAEPFDGRTTAIAHGSQQVLEAIGLWRRVAEGAEPIREIRVADGGSPLFLHYDHRELGDAPLGYIVENRKLRQALMAEAASLPRLRHLAPAAVERVEREEARAVAHLADGGRVTGALVAACDGARSPLRGAAGIKTIAWNYPQVSIVCTVRHALPHRGVAVEHFLPGGPFAILPMTGNRSSIVWTESAALAPALLALDEADFMQELGRRFGDYLGALALEGPRWSHPLSLLHAERYAAPRLALVGDSAHVIHPIAGQGFNLGIRDVAVLAELIVDARRLGLDIGGALLLERYERWRRFDNVMLAAVTDGLNRLFSNALPGITLARDLGLAAVDRLPPVKRFLMRHAMGVIGDLPRLVRGEPL